MPVSPGRLILGVVLATLAVVAWGFAFWGALYAPVGVFQPEPLPQEVAVILQEHDIATGTYFSPWPRNTPEAAEQWLAAHRAGPFFKLSYVREGVDPQSPQKMLGGIAHNMAVAALAACVLLIASPPSYGRRVACVALAGLMGSVFIQLGDVVWFHMPWSYARGALIYELVSWLLLGLVLGRAVQPSAAEA